MEQPLLALPTEPAPVQHGPTPPVIAQVERAVQAVRGLRFEHPVPVEALTNAQLDAKLQAAFAQSFSTDQLQRRGLAWSTRCDAARVAA